MARSQPDAGDQHADPAAAAHRVYLGLGSNLGDRDALLRAALRALAPAVDILRVSSVYDTAPMLVTEQPRFHNLVAEGTTRLDALALLRATQRVEAALGRRPGPRYGPRPMDIDLLLYDDLVLATPELTVPHPRMAERAFVLAPLAELVPERTHPVLGAAIATLLRRLGPADVRRLGPLFTTSG
ncbi:MAG: 2-amino-4-hydroxy-6-hydroxymethyldihydropteridine diphosphokinase [Ktedonobacterales bacterium]|nr:2-amino-4-hydroxy-6-hydroxymethyldihydropteridine diphosphokinase [Ktedonobacterales bacterium]